MGLSDEGDAVAPGGKLDGGLDIPDFQDIFRRNPRILKKLVGGFPRPLVTFLKNEPLACGRFQVDPGIAAAVPFDAGFR